MSNKNNNNNIFKKLIYKLGSFSIIKQIFIIYLFVTLIGSLVLYLPISQTGKVDITYLDALFTSASAFSDTGLVRGTTALMWNEFGQAFIALLILVGGIGFFALKVYIFNIIFFKRPIGLTSRELLSAERGSTKMGVSKELIKNSVTTLLILILVFSFSLTLYFYFTPVDTTFLSGIKVEDWSNGAALTNVDPDNVFIGGTPTGNWGTSIRYGIFHTISGINNAGFDIMGGHSLMGYYHNWGIQIMFITLFVIGGLGYPVIYDTIQWTKAKFKKERYSFSLFSKISTITYAIVAILGLSIAFIFETTSKGDTIWNQSADIYGSYGTKSMAIIFNTMSTRNAGFATVSMTQLTQPTLLLYVILMFIGSSPSSTAGGIRTTTIAIIILSIWKQMTGKKDIRAFNRTIPAHTTSRALSVFATGIFLLFIGTLIGMTSSIVHGGTMEGVPLIYIMFEVSSAFGTTGLSTGITPYLSVGTQIALILFMFIGQLGVSSTLLVWSNRAPKSRLYSYIEEDISIG